MFENLIQPKPDPILSLNNEFKLDNRIHKIDLGIGVYRDEQGKTPIMEAVKQAERQIYKQETNKAYQGLTGDEEYNALVQNFILGGTSAINRACTLQTPGASGALRICSDLIALTKPNATIWLSDPSYVNHQPIMSASKLNIDYYPYFDPQTKQVNESAMLNQIQKLGKNDVLLLHGCCHNPCGADISNEMWLNIAKLSETNGFLPFIDLAYQGFANNVEKDLYGVHLLANRLPELLITTSFSKNFGLYRERTGAAIFVGSNNTVAKTLLLSASNIARGSYSMPPSHGAAIVKTILSDEVLKSQWQDELHSMNARIKNTRYNLVKQLQTSTDSNKFDYLKNHRGMFSLTNLSDTTLSQLKKEHGIYIVKGGRINIAGFNTNQIKIFCDALASVLIKRR